MAAQPRYDTRPDLIPELVDRLIRDYQFKTEGTHLRKGVCPACGKKELWTWLEKPFHLQCARLSKCGWESPVKPLYPELFTQFNTRYPATPEDPNATAKAYLRYARGFDPAPLEGWYKQGTYWHPHADKGTATVRFPLAEGVYWEKLIETVTLSDPATGEREQRSENFAGKYKGLWWQPPGQQILAGDTIHWAEGIFDTIALVLSGRKAVAIMSCANFPEHSMEPWRNLGVTWVLALDPDPAGRSWTLKHIKRLKELGETTACVLPSEGAEKVDWNDLYQKGALDDAQHWKNYRYHGDLLTAETREEKAGVIFSHKGIHSFVFDFGSRTHAFKLDVDKYSKALQQAQDIPELVGNEDAQKQYALETARTVREIATFAMEFRYVEQAEITGERLSFFRFRFPNGVPEENVGLSGAALTSSTEFKKQAATKSPGALWTGTGDHLDMLYRHWFARRHRTITSIDYIGYNKDVGAYLFHDFAVQDGTVIPINADDYFDLGKAGGLKTNSAIPLRLVQDSPVDWFKDFQTAYGWRGLVVLIFWVGALFAEQIREQYRSYPFLEMYGEPGSGKSYLLEYLWKLCGREGYEGFDPNKSTMIGRSRALTQVSNLPTVMIEADRSEEGPHTKHFDWEELKPLFDGEIGRVTGVKNQGNDTRSPPFRGALVIAQNAPVSASDAVMSRIVQVHFSRAHHTEKGREASDRLNRLDIDEVSGFVKRVVTKEKAILERFHANAKQHEKFILEKLGIKMVRIAKCHGQMMALADCLPLILPIGDDEIEKLNGHIGQLAVERQQAMNSDHPMVQRFWDVFFYLDRRAVGEINGPTKEQGDFMNHSRSPEKEIAVNLEHFREQCAKNNQEPFSAKDLRELLPTSKRYPFIENKHVNSRLTNTTLRCWVFGRGGAGNSRQQ
jgi:hypothetical protein